MWRGTIGFFLFCYLSLGQSDSLGELWSREIGRNVRRLTIKPGLASSTSFRLGPGVTLVYVAPPDVGVRLIDPHGAVITRENAPDRSIQWSGGPGGFRLPASMEIAGGDTGLIEVESAGVYTIEGRVTRGNQQRLWAVSMVEPLKAARAAALKGDLEVAPSGPVRANDLVRLRNVYEEQKSHRADWLVPCARLAGGAPTTRLSRGRMLHGGFCPAPRWWAWR